MFIFTYIYLDAIFIKHSLPLESVINRCEGRELIIAEDMHPTCVINAGVFILRVGEWVKSLISDVWNEATKFDKTFFYDQSALVRSLRMRHEGLESVKPFHSYTKPKSYIQMLSSQSTSINALVTSTDNHQYCIDEEKVYKRVEYKHTEKMDKKALDHYMEKRSTEVKLFPHTAVLTHLDLNTNSGWKDVINNRPICLKNSPRFIFHAAGRCRKLKSIQAMIRIHGLASNKVIQSVQCFTLERSKMGLPPNTLMVKDRDCHEKSSKEAES